MTAPRARMTHWYSVPRLIDIGARVGVSTIFGEFADRRSVVAAERLIDPAAIDRSYVYTPDEDGNFWFDFAADTGDGWDSTYAIARLLSAPSIDPAGNTDGALRRGRLLVLGGDEVYPTPSDEDYQVKFVAPFDEASRGIATPDRQPDLYAMPGNHDWYDGLSAFLNLFCWRQLPGPWSPGRRGHPIGLWRTQQTRTYFALQLPHKWWLWGTDIQLTNYIDQAQIDFFDHVAREWMPEDARLILCAGVPDWVYADPSDPEKTFTHFSFVEGILHRVGRGQHLAVILTGDSHHYSRYREDDRHYITAGGAGAFLHPTHHLPEQRAFDWDWPRPNPSVGPSPAPLPPGQRSFVLAHKPDGTPSVFPDQARSRRLTWCNLAFAAFNWDFALATGAFWALLTWGLDATAHATGSSLPSVLNHAEGFWTGVWAYLTLAGTAPWPLLVLVALLAGFYYLADFKARGLVGSLHTCAQFVPVVLATAALARSGAPWAHSSAGLIIWVGVAGGLIGSTVLGVYFLISLNCFGKHWNEAFSALRNRHYKNFLRLRIDRSGALTIYPIGLERVPKDRSAANPDLSPTLIEPPIQIR